MNFVSPSAKFMVSLLFVLYGCTTLQSSRGLEGGSLPPCNSQTPPEHWSDCYGTVSYTNGKTYKGEFAKGFYHGRGEIKYANGTSYVGSFAGGKKSGNGKAKYANGDVYTGKFLNGLPHGQGNFVTRQGDTYKGQFKEGAYDGRGTYNSHKGFSYIGEFKNGNYSGLGRLTLVTGNIQEGVFQGGRLESKRTLPNSFFASITGEGITKVEHTDANQGDEIEKLEVSTLDNKKTQRISTPPNIADQPRIALVIGNGTYRGISKLRNPPNDARLMAQTLRRLKFDVIEVIDANQKNMKRAVSRFSKKLKTSGEDSVGLFYFAGHGIQVDGRNYLIPVDAKVETEADLDIEALDANTVMRSMEYGSASLNFAILDACRNNPYSSGFRSGSRGLARMDAPRGTLIAYATRPGDIANDGDGVNSPYTTALAKALLKPGLTVSDVFIEVRNEVMRRTGEKQVPWEEGGLTSRFYFAGK